MIENSGKVSATLLACTPNAEELIEIAARTCYQSKVGDEEKRGAFIKQLIRSGHESVLEHAAATFIVTCSRACSHQAVRHRIASYSQKSQRYVKVKDPRFIIPPSFSEEQRDVFLDCMIHAIDTYDYLREHGAKPEDARFIFPNAMETEIVMSMNMRAWRHFLDERGPLSAQWEIRSIACKILNDLKQIAPNVFYDYHIVRHKESVDAIGDDVCLSNDTCLSKLFADFVVRKERFPVA